MPDEQPNGLKPLEHSIFVRVSKLILGAWERIHRAWFRWADLNQHAGWFPLFVGGVVGVDAIIVVLPGDVVVALAVLSNPKAWKRLAVYAGLGGALGAFTLYLLLHSFGKAPLDQLAALGGPVSAESLNELGASVPDVESGLAAAASSAPPKWELARAFFDKYGLFSLALGSVIPFFSWPPVVLAGLSSDRWFEVLFWLLLGRQLRYWLLCFGLREGWAMFTTLREEAREKRAQRGHQGQGPPDAG